MPAAYANIHKACETCGTELRLNNTRDVDRKRFCSRHCLGKSHRFSHEDRARGYEGMRGVKKTLTPAFMAAQAARPKRGAESPFWIDGRTPETHVRTNRGSWRRLADSIRQRDGNVCVYCKTSGVLPVHHIEPWNGDNDTEDNLVTLCHACHGKVHHPAGIR